MDSKPPTKNPDNQEEDFQHNPLGIYASGYEEHPSYEKERTERKRYISKMMIEILTLIFAGAVGVFTFNIMLDTGKQAKETERSVNESIKASQQSVALSQRTVEIADSNMRIDNRAWVGIDSIVLGWTIDSLGKKIARGVISMKNSGKTPAIDLRITQEMRILKHPCPNDSLLELVKIGHEPSRGLVFPNTEVSSYATLVKSKYPEMTIDDLKVRKLKVVVYGKIEYWDIWGSYHMTKFCGYSEGNRVFTFCPCYNSVK